MCDQARPPWRIMSNRANLLAASRLEFARLATKTFDGNETFRHSRRFK
jgi:hypothetical protein